MGDNIPRRLFIIWYVVQDDNAFVPQDIGDKVGTTPSGFID